MATKLPHLQIKINKDLDGEVHGKHDAAKERLKSYADEKRRAKVKDIKAGDQILLQQNKIISQASIHRGGRPGV